jgi:DNA polymerase-3 subunit alpha
MITEARRLTTKKGDTMCVVRLEDEYGWINVTVFPKVYEQTLELWAEDTVVIIRGEVQVRNDELNILCDSAERFLAVDEEINRKKYQVSITVQLTGSDEKSISDDTIRIYDLYNCIREKPGRDRYNIRVSNGEWEVLLQPDNDTMHYSPETRTKLEQVLAGKGMIEAQIIAQ